MASGDDFIPSQVTITLLPTALSLVRIPRARLPALSHPLLKQILQPDPVFLNVTANEIELSLIADQPALAEFEPIARADRQRRRRGSSSGSSVASGVKKYRNVTTALNDSPDAVEVSYEHWNVLQIDSHASSAENSGARVRELSAPLAAAGISILYQSSYTSDFLLVKSSRLQEALSLFAAAGLYLHSADPEHLTSTTAPLGYPLPSGDLTDEPPSRYDFTAEGAVLTRSRSSTDASRRNSLFRLPSFELKSAPEGEQSDDLTPQAELPESVVVPPETITEEPQQKISIKTKPRKQTSSPAAVSVDVLSPDLACVGLTDDAVDLWSLKIVKLVAYPDLIPASPLTSRSRNHRRSRLTDGSHGFNAEVNMKLDELRQRHGPDAQLVPFSMDVTVEDLSVRSSSGTSSPMSSEEEAYFSTSPYSVSTPSLFSETSSSRSCPDLEGLASKRRRSSAAHSTTAAATQLTSELPQSATTPRADHGVPEISNAPPPTQSHDVVGASRAPLVSGAPFFSFTRTREGSSLTTDIALLVALFPPNERHMVLCGDELDAADRLAAAGTPAEYAEDDEDDCNSGGVEGTLKCLQIDLQRFGLEKHGLVNRFSQVLDDNGINHMYSSTFKTANLLVEKADARRAQSLLRSC